MKQMGGVENRRARIKSDFDLLLTDEPSSKINHSDVFESSGSIDEDQSPDNQMKLTSRLEDTESD